MKRILDMQSEGVISVNEFKSIKLMCLNDGTFNIVNASANFDDDQEFADTLRVKLNMINCSLNSTSCTSPQNISSSCETTDMITDLHSDTSGSISTDSILPLPSEEQIAIIDKLAGGENAIVNAVAGAGKTTTSLLIAQYFKSRKKKILLLTYNSKLKQEARKRAKSLELDNVMECHSYHSFCNCYYARCFNEDMLKEIVCKDTCPYKQLRLYDIIIVDEAQDMTPLMYAAVRKILRDIKATPCSPQFVITGDWRQCIFKVKDLIKKYIFKVYNY